MAKTKAATEKPSAKGFDGERLVALLGASPEDPRIVEVVRELGYRKPIDSEVELKKLGISMQFADGKLQQIQFEIRRRWTGHARYEGRLPFDISPDLLTTDRATVLADRATGGEEMDNNWYRYRFPTYEIAMGFGKKYVETVFVIANK